MSVQNEQNDFRFPVIFLYIVALICALPYGLNLIGIDFSSAAHDFHVEDLAAWNVPKAVLVDEMFYALTGGLQHGLLEWSAVSVAALTILLAFSHFAINKDVTVPIIGIALFCSGTMDAFHTLAAMRLIDAVADNSNLIPFTWALSRGFNAAILIVGVLICLKQSVADRRTGIVKIIVVSLFFGGLAYLLIAYSATNENLPLTQFPDSFITRPYDVVPLLLFVLAGPIFWKLYRKKPNLLTASMCIALLPESVLEAHMVFGSSSLFDNHFNIAHFLKIIAYLIPFIGLVLDYLGTYKKLNVVIEELKKTNLDKQQIGSILEDSQRRTAAILNNTVDAIITIDEKGIVDQFNFAAEGIFGYKDREVLGKNIKMLMPEPYKSEHDDYLTSYLTTGKTKIIGMVRELIGQRKDGSQFPITLAVSEINFEEFSLFTGIVRDISEQKRLEKEKVAMIQDLQEANQELEEFSYRTSHDLKAPLVNIRGLSDIMRDDLIDGDYDEVTANIEKIGVLTLNLESLVGDIELAAQADHLNEEIEEVDIVKTVDSIKENLNTLIDEKQVEVRVENEVGKPVVLTQTKIIYRVLDNLISNAIKYSDPGKPQRFVKIAVSESSDGAQIQVSDNGLGIPEEYLGEVFSMFKRFHKSSSFGSGLGLYLVKKDLCKINGGISVESNMEGTIFTISLPVHS